MDLKDQLKNLFPDHVEQEVPEEEKEQYKTKGEIFCKFEKKGRNGKPVTLVEGFEDDEEMKTIAKLIKTKLAIGGSVKDNTIIFQGNNRDKIMDILHNNQYKTKRIGG